ncbi:DUF342 domain-containing protein [Rhabdochromatium marinum]|uniref:DUF342 domain-containing protein n=1 Tax=Rhabdochromatium marinum TaxID=48729 RepID=UPI001908FA07|nr:FapA family protein [Rhabdochromatium marinum]MBK1647680.1 hypothetical protein [Rhabdochromatium marinum]
MTPDSNNANPPSATQTQVTLQRNPTGTKVLAVVSNGEQPLTIDKNWLVAELNSSGLKGAQISKQGIQKLQRMLLNKEDGEIEIGECHDAIVSLQVSEDKLSAKLLLKTARGGEPATVEHVTEVINHFNLASQLIDHAAINRLLAAAPKATAGTTLQIVIARGKAPVDGQHSIFEPLVEITERRPTRRADGSLNYRELGAIPTVNPGDHLMRRHPPTPGVDGYRVNGEPIKAKNGRLLQFGPHKGAVVSEEDPNLLVASITGQPVLQPNGASVDPLLKVKDVNLRSGNIDYDGSLLVQGSVSPGMQIRVTGDVLITEMVECAELIVGGNLNVKMGISGPTEKSKQEYQDLSMSVRCGGNLSAGHVENATLDVKGDITIKSQLTHCQVSCDNQLIVGSAGQQRSGIVGGRVRATKLIRAYNLGAEAGIATAVMLQCSNELMEQLNKVKENIVYKQGDLARLARKMVEQSKKKDADTEERLNELKQQSEAAKADAQALATERDQLQAVITAMLDSSIDVPGNVYPRVSITIGDQTQEVGKVAREVSFSYDDGKLLMRPLEKDAKAKARK